MMKPTSERQIFGELVEDGEVVPVKPRGVPLSKWEDLEKQRPKFDEKTFRAVNPPRPSR